MNKSKWIKLVALSGFLIVALGAFGAHALEAILTTQRMQVLQTAIQYQTFHTLALLGVICIPDGLLQAQFKTYAARCFALGILLFCGSLYLLVFSNVKAFAMITPLGGVAFLLAWLLVFVAALRAE